MAVREEDRGGRKLFVIIDGAGRDTGRYAFSAQKAAAIEASLGIQSVIGKAGTATPSTPASLRPPALPFRPTSEPLSDTAFAASRIELKVTIRYEFVSSADGLSVQRTARFPDGTTKVLTGALAQLDPIVNHVDLQAEKLLAPHADGDLPAETARQLLTLLEPSSDLMLDGQRVALGMEPVLFRVRVSDDGEAFKVALVRPNGIDKLFHGAALIGDRLHPTSYGNLTPDQRKLLARGALYAKNEVGALVGEVLPKLAVRIPVDIGTSRIPQRNSDVAPVVRTVAPGPVLARESERPCDVVAIPRRAARRPIAWRRGGGFRRVLVVPRVSVGFCEKSNGLEILATMVYGKPPILRISGDGTPITCSGVVAPARDPQAERRVGRCFEERTGLRIGQAKTVLWHEITPFLQTKLLQPDYSSEDLDPRWLQVKLVDLSARISVRDEGNAWEIDIQFGGPSGEADPRTVLDVFHNGRFLAPLRSGGFAAIPTAWLATNGTFVQELLNLRDATGRVPTLTVAIIKLLERTGAHIQAELGRLQVALGAVPAGAIHKMWMKLVDSFPSADVDGGSWASTALATAFCEAGGLSELTRAIDPTSEEVGQIRQTVCLLKLVGAFAASKEHKVAVAAYPGVIEFTMMALAKNPITKVKEGAAYSLVCLLSRSLGRKEARRIRAEMYLRTIMQTHEMRASGESPEYRIVSAMFGVQYRGAFRFYSLLRLAIDLLDFDPWWFQGEGDWEVIGTISGKAAGELQFLHSVPERAGIYKIVIAGGSTYVEEASNMNVSFRRLLRANDEGRDLSLANFIGSIRSALRSDMEVVVQVLTTARVVVGGKVQAVNLKKKKDRELTKHAAIVEVLEGGGACSNSSILLDLNDDLQGLACQLVD